MKNVYLEKKEYLIKRFSTKIGLFDFFVGSFIWGFLIVNYKDEIYGFVYNLISFLPSGILREYIAYLGFGVILTPFGLFITYVLTRIYKILFKNDGRIIDGSKFFR